MTAPLLHLATRPDPTAATDPDPLTVQILRGDHDDTLDALAHAIGHRRHLLDEQHAALTLARARPGQRVRLNHHIRPKYLIGAHATITAIADGNIHVDLDYPIRRYGPHLTCHPILIDPIDGPE